MYPPFMRRVPSLPVSKPRFLIALRLELQNLKLTPDYGQAAILVFVACINKHYF